MDQRPDGRMYARITRRSRAILETMENGRSYALDELVDLIADKAQGDFYLSRFERVMSDSRLRVYVRYLAKLEAIDETSNGLIRSFRLRNSDEQWAQALSDAGRKHIAEMLDEKVSEVPDRIKEATESLLSSGRPATVPGLLGNFGITGGRDEELFRWSLYMLCDGGTSKIEIRRFPTIWLEG